MFKSSALITFYAETPIHMGAGQSVSYVDLPIQRERHTQFPTLWSSGIKGVMRDLASRKKLKEVEEIFGPEPGSGSEFASCISITDAKVLLYPVRSLKGIFGWITCPFVLNRFKEDLEACGIELNSISFEEDIPDEKILISKESSLIFKGNKVFLEEYSFDLEEREEVGKLAKCLKTLIPKNLLTESLEKRIAVVSDNIFRHFVNYAVEIRTRIRIDPLKGTVGDRALFSEEYVPSESVFYSLMFATDSKKEGSELKASEVMQKIEGLLDDSIIQLGGDETIGKGIVRVKVFRGGGACKEIENRR